MKSRPLHNEFAEKSARALEILSSSSDLKVSIQEANWIVLFINEQKSCNVWNIGASSLVFWAGLFKGGLNLTLG